MSYGNQLSRAIYYRCPAWAQEIACSIYGYKHRRRWQGQVFYAMYRSLQINQWRSADELIRIQWLRLHSLLRHTYETVPFYRDRWRKLGIAPDDIKSAADLCFLPLLDKDTLRKHSDSFRSSAFRPSELIRSNTSGTTGKQLTIWVSRECYEREYSFRWHHYSWCGVSLGVRRAYFSGHPVKDPDSASAPFSRRNHAENSLIFSSQHLSEKNLGAYVEELKSYCPELIEGYPSSIYLLSSYIYERGISMPRPRGIVLTSETVFEYQRAMIERAFGCKVFNWYGNTERAGNITECPDGGLHIQPEHAVIEVLNHRGIAASAGEDGEIVATALGNFAFPLIRYRVGDIAGVTNAKCQCGREGSLVSKVIGRIEGYVLAPDGRAFGRLDHIFKDAKNVKEAQIEQDRPDHLTIRVVLRTRLSEQDRTLIYDAARERVGTIFQIDILEVREIARGPNSKFHFIVNRIANPQQIRQGIQNTQLDVQCSIADGTFVKSGSSYE